MFEIAVVNEPSVFEPLKFYCGEAYQWGSNLNSLTTKQQTRKFSSANFQKKLSQSISY